MAPSRRATISLTGITVLTLLLTLSTFLTLSPGFFFTFVLLNGIAQAAFGSYLQNSVIAVASLFGPAAVQAMLAGQAAVAVVVSTVQVISAAASVHTSTESMDGPAAIDASDVLSSRARDPEERSAFIFFGLSTIFLVFSAAAHRWLVSLPAYHSVVSALEARKPEPELGTDDERRILVSAGPSQGLLTQKQSIWRVAKTNVLYEIAVAYVFTVTLVC